MTPTLYDIAAEYRALAEQIAGECGDDEQTLVDTLEAIRAPLEAKAVNVALVLRNAEAAADAIDEAIKRMQSRSRGYRN